MAARKDRKTEAEGEALPSPEEAVVAFAAALEADMAHPRHLLAAMSRNSPQLLHLEGGLESVPEGEASGDAESAGRSGAPVGQRTALALWWAALLNCEHAASRSDDLGRAPCLQCPSCLRIGANMHPDVLCLDGHGSTIKMDTVRALRPLLGEPPRFGRKRVILMLEAQSLGVEAANSLLKSLEEPCPDTCFVFTVPQRESLLPTLVSRGWVLTLPWPDPSRPLPEKVREWAMALAEFAQSGTGWFGRSSAKGAVDSSLAQQVILAVQKALADRLAGRRGGALTSVLASMPDVLTPVLDELLAQTQQAVQDQVNPALALDAMAVRLHLLVHGRRPR